MTNRIDCSITENYFKEKTRALQPSNEEYCTIECKDCPFHKNPFMSKDYPHRICTVYEMLCLADAISRIQAWSDTHPRKTYKDDLFERLPNARKDEEGYPCADACDIYDDDMRVLCGDKSCHECWDLPMKEQ